MAMKYGNAFGRSAPVRSAPNGSAVHGVNQVGSAIGFRDRVRKRRMPEMTRTTPAAANAT